MPSSELSLTLPVKVVSPGVVWAKTCCEARVAKSQSQIGAQIVTRLEMLYSNYIQEVLVFGYGGALILGICKFPVGLSTSLKSELSRAQLHARLKIRPIRASIFFPFSLSSHIRFSTLKSLSFQDNGVSVLRTLPKTVPLLISAGAVSCKAPWNVSGGEDTLVCPGAVPAKRTDS